MASGVIGLRAVITVLLGSLIPAAAIAGPIFDHPREMFEDRQVPSGHVLDADDWAILEARDDRGWHLGWFKSKKHGDESRQSPVDPPDIDDVFVRALPDLFKDAPIAATLPPGPIQLLDDGDAATQSTNGVAVPEPGALMLFASGLFLLARRLRRRQA